MQNQQSSSPENIFEHFMAKDPSADQMRAFAAHFSKEQWGLCCEFEEFLEAFSYDLKQAGLVAIEILSYFSALMMMGGEGDGAMVPK